MNNPARLRLLGLAVSAALTACGGGGGTDTGTPATPTSSVPSTTTAATAGVWKGTVTSTTTGQTAAVVSMTMPDGHSAWMATDGRVWQGEVPKSGEHFDAMFTGHMSDGRRFPDGTSQGPWTMNVEHHTTSMMSGRAAGGGDAGTFSMNLSSMWDRHASLETVAGVYTRSTSSGYTMTMTIGANGQIVASDSSGCTISGTIRVPDPIHNVYGIDATVSSCGSLDGTYHGMGTLLDADAMQDWMAAMHPIEHGSHTHGGMTNGGSPMMGGSGMMGGNTVPSGTRNLFMFAMFNEHNAIMDALAH